jgi:hypothetical protein
VVLGGDLFTGYPELAAKLADFRLQGGYAGLGFRQLRLGSLTGRAGGVGVCSVGVPASCFCFASRFNVRGAGTLPALAGGTTALL